MGINTEKWDTVYALSFEQMNNAIKNDKNLKPRSFWGMFDSDGNALPFSNFYRLFSGTFTAAQPQGSIGKQNRYSFSVVTGGSFKYLPKAAPDRNESIALQKIDISLLVDKDWAATGSSAAAKPVEIESINYNDSGITDPKLKLTDEEKDKYFKAAVLDWFSGGNSWITTPKVVNFIMAVDDAGKNNISNASFRVFSGTLGVPLLTVGGSGQNVFMSIDLPAGAVYSYSPKAVGMRPPTYTLDAVEVLVQTNLEWVDSNKPFIKNLKVSTKTPVELLNMVYSAKDQKDLSTSEKANIQVLIANWLHANPDFFDFSFASANINNSINKEGFAWVTPTKTSYAVVQKSFGEELSKAVFGILCMTNSHRPPNENQLSIECLPTDDEAIKAGVNSGFVISAERFVEDLLFPSVPYLFVDADVKKPEKNFRIDGLSIVNTQKLTLIEQTLKNGKKVTPTVDLGGFSLSVQEDALEMKVDLSFEYQSGYTVKMSHTSYSTLVLHNRADGSKTLGTAYRSGTTTIDVVTSSGVFVLEIGLSIAGAVVAALIGAGIEAGLQCFCKGAQVTAQAATEQEMSTLTEPLLNSTTNVVEGATSSFTETATTGIWYSFDDEIPASVFAQTAVSVGTQTAAETTAQIGAVNTTRWAILSFVLATCFEAGIVAIPGIIEHHIKGTADKMPSLDALTNAALTKVIWPNTKATAYSLEKIWLKESLLFGVKVDFNPPKTKTTRKAKK